MATFMWSASNQLTLTDLKFWFIYIVVWKSEGGIVHNRVPQLQWLNFLLS